MRGKIVVLLFLVIFSFSVVLAVPVLEFSHDEIIEGETAFATITVDGEFNEEIEDYQLEFFDGRKKVFVEADIFFYNDTHYVSLYTTRPGQFVMKVNQILYEQAGQLHAYTIEYPLNISSASVFIEEENATLERSLSIRPGYFFSSSTPSIDLINRGEVVLNISVLDEVVSLGVAETYGVVFEPEEKFSFLQVSSYKDFFVPIVYLSDFDPNESTIQKEPELKVEPSLLFSNVLVGEEVELNFSLFNFGEGNITNMSMSVVNASYLILPEVNNLSGREVKNVTIIVSPQIVGNLKGEITISYTQVGKFAQTVIPYSFFVLPQGSNESDFNVSAPDCESVGAVSCLEDCDGRGIFIEGGQFCCVGQCKPYSSGGGGSIDDKESFGGWSWIIGVLILLVLGFVGYAFYKKSKKVSSGKPEDKIKQVSDKYTKRVSGGLQRT